MSQPSFREATDLLCLSAPEASSLFGRPAQTIRQMRLDADHPNWRPPPDGWEAILAKIARKKGGQLVRLADALEKSVR